MFYFFLMMFLLKYLNIPAPKPVVYGWAALECAVTGVYWQDDMRAMLFGNIVLSRDPDWEFMTARIEQSTLYLIRYSLLCFILVVGLLYGTTRLFGTKVTSERQNLARLAGAQFVIAVSLMVQLLANPAVDIVPLFSSLSLMSVVVSIATDGFFGVTDRGHDWVFAQMDDAYIIVDSIYGYLDANNAAKELFPELNGLRQGKEIPDALRVIFTAAEGKCTLGDRVYAKRITEIRKVNKLSGYGLLLADMTEQQKLVELLNNYNSQLEWQVAEKTAHIQAIQDSMITRMASVVESRDNSTGGHINRTSAVVRIFAKHLLQEPEFGFDETFLDNVSKAAPMPYDKAFEIITEGLGTQFDPKFGKVFIECRSELESYYDNNR